jgi:glutamate--cysteine ligase
MYFVVRDGKYHDCTHLTFRQAMAGALKGEVADWQINLGDWTNHLSTLFPDVRLKRFLEMRGADGGPWRRICGLPAFWVGLLYEANALDAAEALTRDWTFEEVEQLRNAVPSRGLDAEFGGRSLWEIGRDVLEISRAGLKSRARQNASGEDESVFLAPLDEMVAKRSTLADDMLALWTGRWAKRIDAVFDDYQY